MNRIAELMQEIYEPLDDELALPTNATPVDFFQSIYRDPRQPMGRRLRAAESAAPFCHPKLSASADMTANFAELLEAQMVAQGKPTVIDCTPQTDSASAATHDTLADRSGLRNHPTPPQKG